MSFAPQSEAFAVAVAETAVVGDGISAENGSALKYKGVNSMVGTLISWNGKNGGYNLHSTAHMSSVWVIDNKGEMVNGANKDRCPPINFYSKKNDNLSAIKLIAGKNATPNEGTTVAEKPKLYKGEKFDNITTGTFNGQQNVKYFTVGGKDASPQDISSDWAKAIFAASLYSNSGILDNEDFGGKKADGEYPTGWIPEYQAITGKVSATDSNAKYVTKFGTPFNEKLEENNKAGNYNYIAIKLESDWTATDVSKIEDKEKDATNEPVGAKGHIGRLSNGVADNDKNGDTLLPLGTTFDANYDKHIMSDIDTGNVYLNSVYTNGKVDTGKSTDPVALSDRIKNYATSYNEEVRTQQLTFCPAGEGYSFGRLAIPDNAYVILDLNGHKIDRNLIENAANVDTIVQSVFILGQYSRLEVFDSSVSDEHPFGTGEVTGGYTKNGTGKVFDNQKWDNYGSDSNYANAVKGGGFTLRNRAELTVHSGNVTNNQGLFGGAFYGVGASTVNVFDANIEGNSAVRGGMCYLSQGSFMTLNMFGGLVQGNSARMDGFAEKNSKGYARQPSVTDPTAETDDGIYDTKYKKNPDGYGHEGGGICVYQESYCNIYGGSITHNYSATFGGGISVSYNSFLKLFGGEITGNVAKGMIRNINGAKVVSESNPKETETPKANVGGAGINMYQDSAGIYLNGPAKVMGNYCSQVEPDESYTAAAIAAVIENDEKKEDSNLYLSLTTSMARYSWNSDHYEDSKTRYKLTGDWDAEYGPTFAKGASPKENQAVSRKGQMMFDPKQHLYPEIKVQGPLYRDANHVAQVSITPAAGIEAGGYIMRQFYPKGWEDSSDKTKQSTTFNGTDGARPLKSGAEGTIDESSHAKNQINANGGTTFNLREFLKTGATSGYVDGFLFTDGGTSIVAGTGDDDGWYLALGTRQEGNLPVKWQYYDSTVDPKTNKPYGWLDATTSAESGTGFTLVYNGTDRKYDIRVFVDRTKLTSDESGVTSGYFYLYYDYYTVADETGKETEPEADGTAKKHYLYASDADKNSGKYTNILYITSGYDDSDMEIVQDKGVIYASERYDILGYRFTIRADAKDLKGAGDGTATPFNEKDDFVANPNYATMKIERATLMVSQIKLADITRYYDGTRDFYIPSTTITASTLTGQAPNDQSKLLMKFSGESDGYVHGTLSSPNVGTNNVSLGVIIEELGGEDHEGHNKNTFPDKCLLANYMLYDLNTETTYPAEDREEMSVTLNVNVQPKPITVELEKQSYEYGSIPIFDSYWGTHADSANWAQTYEKAKDGATLKALFEPGNAPVPGEPDFNPNELGLDGKLAKVDIDDENVDPDHGTADKSNLALRLDQILKISFSSTYTDRSPVGIYGGSFSYTNGNYNVTWQFGENKVAGMGTGGNLTPAQVDNLIEITKRKIKAEIPDLASIYGEAQETLTLPEEKITHANGGGDGLVFGDSLSATLDLADAEKVKTSTMLRATVDAAGNKIDKNEHGYYEIYITNLDKINPNYELTEENVTRGKYTVYPRKIVLKAGDYNSVYGDPVNTDKMGGFTSSLAAEQKEGLHTSSTVILPVDEAAFNKGVSYAYSDTGAHKNKGEYKFNVKFDHAAATEGGEDIGINYAVSYGDEATHTIEAREVTVLIASPTMQSSEYGETPEVQQGNGTGTYWMPQFTSNAVDKTTIVLDKDWDNFVDAIELYVAKAVNETAPAGKYPLMGKYTGSANYTVDFSGMWNGEVEEKYKDPDYGELNGHAGTYTINRRNIVLDMSTELVSEYGDDLVKFWEYLTGYTFSREGGGDALVNGDSLTFAAGLFYIQVSSSQQIHDNRDGIEKFENNKLHSGTYPVFFDLSKYKGSKEYNTGANANYEITTDNGMYTVDKRAIQIEIGAKLDTGFTTDVTMEYGGEVPARMANVTRTTKGKVGDGFVGSDGDALDAYLATDNSISHYSSSLTTSHHLGVGTYNFTADQNKVSNDYNVTWVFGTLTVTARKVTVTLDHQTVVYGDGETVGNTQGVNWTAALSEDSTYKEGAAILEDDDLHITITKAPGANVGTYDLSATYSNNNYDVNFVGGSGGYTIAKRNIIIKIGDLSAVYGVSIAVSSVQGTVWSVVEDGYGEGTLEKNWKKGTTAQYNNDNLGITLKLATTAANFTDKDKNSVLKVGSYAIIVDGSSLNENYNFYFKGAWEGDGSYAGDAHMSGEYKAHAGIFEVTKRAIVIRPNDTSSTYGDMTLEDINAAISGTSAWGANSAYAGDAILKDDLDELAQCISFSLTTVPSDVRASGYLGAGSYAMVGYFDTTHDPGRICDNYTVTFEGSWTGEKNSGVAGTYTVNKRDITLTVIAGVMTYEYDGKSHDDDILDFGAEYEKTKGTGWTLDSVFSLTEGTFATPIAEKSTDGLNTLGITLRKDTGAAVGSWSVTASYTNDDYNVTFEGTRQAVTITPRKIVVHIHDQYAIYGENETVNQAMGKDADNGAWHAEFAEDSVYSLGDAIVEDDDLNLSLTKHFGASVNKVGYAIYGMYMNTNYAVTYEGNFKGDGAYTDKTSFAGHAGAYIIVARKIAVEILDQHNIYGEVPSLSAAQNVAWKLYEGSFTPSYDHVSGSNLNTIVNNDNLELTFATNATQTTKVAEKCNIIVKYNNPNYDVTFYYNNSSLSLEGGEATANGALITDKRAISIALYGVTVKYGDLPDGAKLYTYSDHQELLIGNKNGTNWTPRSALSGNGGAIVNGDNLVLVVGIWYYDSDKNEGKPYEAGIYVADAGKCYVYARLATKEDQAATVKDGVNMFTDLGDNDNYDIMVVGTPAFDGVLDPKGHYTITSGSTQYTSGAATLTIEKRNLTVTPNSQEVTYGEDGDVSKLGWTAGGDGYFEGDRAKFEELGGVQFEKEPTKSTSGHIIVGTYTLVLKELTDAELAARANYIIKREEGTYTVTPKPITVQITNGEGEYTGQRPTGLVPMTLSTENGLIGGDKVSIARSVLTNVDGTWNAGKYPIQGTVMGDDCGNYTVTLTGDWRSTDSESAFVDASDGKNGVYTIKPIAITVEFLKQKSVYGSGSATLATNYSAIRELGWKVTSGSMVVGETLTFNVDIVGAKSFANYYIFTGTYNVKLTFAQNKNYTIIFKYDNGSFGKSDVIAPDGGSLTIEGAFEVQKRAITVRINDKGHTYDGTELGGGAFDTDGYTVTGVTNDIGDAVVRYSGMRDDLDIKLTKADGVNAGTYAITGTCGNNNYDVTWQGSWSGKDANEGKAGTYTIHKKAITVQIGDQGSTFAGKSASYVLEQGNTHWSVVGDALVEADKAADKFTVTLSIVNPDGSEWHAKSYAIKANVSGAKAGNYEVTFSGDWSGADDHFNRAGTYTVSPLELKITLQDQTSVYDGTEPTELNVKYGEREAWVFTSETIAKLGGLLSGTDLDGEPIDSVLKLELSKELGVNVGTYKITLVGWGNSDYALTVDDAENKAYSITPRSVTVTVYSQSGVYGGDQDKGIDSAQFNAWVVKEGEVLERDNLEITIRIVFETNDISTLGQQLNAGWYSIKVTYKNNNYNVTFECEHKIVTTDGNVTAEDVSNHEISGTDDGQDTYTVKNGYRIYPRRLEITVANQEGNYQGTLVEPTVKQKKDLAEAWKAINVLNGSMPPFVTEAEEAAFEVTLKVKAAANGKWNAGTYQINGEVTSEADKNNYVIERVDSGTFTIDPLNVTVKVKEQKYAVYNGTDWAGDFLAKSKTVTAFADNLYWTATDVLEEDQELFAKAIQLVLMGDAVNANTYSASGEWRDGADENIKTNYVVTYEGGNAFTVNKRHLKVEIENATSVYGEELVTPKKGAITCDNDKNGTGNSGIIGGDDLGITLSKLGGTNVGKYAIVGTWNLNNNYEVTFTGSWSEEDANKDQAGTYTITERKLTVHINDQGGVFGGRTYTNLSSFQGENEHNGGWFIKDFTDRTGISPHNQQIKNYVIPGDSLQIVLTLNTGGNSEDYAGKCSISAVCNNPNYEVKFEGSWAEDDDYNGIAGTFTVQKRQVTVTLRDQTATYDGDTHTATEFSSKNLGWTEAVTNDDDNNTVTFVEPRELGGGRKTAPEIAIDLRMVGARNGGIYKVHIVIKRDNVTIFDSAKTEIDGITVKRLENGSVVISTNEYEITVVGTTVRDEVGAESDEVKVCSVYTITPKEVTLTIEDKTSTYGETERELSWKDRANGIVAGDRAAVEAAIKLAIQDREEHLRGEQYLTVGTYRIKATVDSGDTTGNYNFIFTGTTGTPGYGLYTVNKRSIGLRVSNVSVTYGGTPAFSYTEISVGSITGKVILDCDQGAFADVIKYETLNRDFSNSKHLKAGSYPIWMSLDDTKGDNYKIVTDNYDITFTGLWSDDGTYTDNVTELNSRAGVLTVSKKTIAVTGITSKSGAQLTSEYGDAVPNDWTYSAAPNSVLEGDNVTVVYNTEASARADVGTYPITVALAAYADGNDNENYTMSMRAEVNYTIKKRRVKLDIPAENTIIYGNEIKYPDVVVTRTNGGGAWNEYADGEKILVEVDYTVEGAMLSTGGFLRVKMESGRIVGYDITVSLSGDNAGNYDIRDTTLFEKKLIVNKRPVTVTIDNKGSVYGETEQELTYSVTNLASGDDRSLLGITLTREGSSSGQRDVGEYAITGAFNCTDYDVTFSGAWSKADSNQGKAGVYNITVRNVRIEIHNQSAPYGEAINVTSTEGSDWEPLSGADVDGTRYYSVRTGDSLGIKLQLETEPVGHPVRGAYKLILDESSVNHNYKVTVVRTELPDDAEAKEKFPEDFSSSSTSIGKDTWGYRTPISNALRGEGHGMFFVTIREVDIFINDQGGVYGEDHILLQYGEAYTISLTKDKGTTGDVFIDGLAVRFDLVTTAYGTDGSGSGKLSYAGTYPIFSSGITATQNNRELENNDPILQNYRFNFTGNWSMGGYYPSGSLYDGRVGVFTVQKRNVTITVYDVNATYGATYKGLSADGGDLMLSNQKGYMASVGNGTGSAFVTVADEALFNIALTVRYRAENVSMGRALKAGTYSITSSKRETLEGNKAFNSYNVTFASTDPQLTVEKANITINILSGIMSSEYGEKLTDADVSWNSKAHRDMFDATVGSGYVEGDVLDFVMCASLIDEVKAGGVPKAGNYAIYVKEWQDLADNANYNLPTWTGSFTHGVKSNDDHYANRAGIYTVRKKEVVVTINDAESEYGEAIDNKKFSFTLPADWQVGDDTVADLGITLVTDANANSPVSATGYAIRGYSSSANYEVTFKGTYFDDASGTLTVEPRRIVVVIRPQSSVYGSNAVASYETSRWFVVRGGSMVDWRNQTQSTVWASVFGEAKEKNMGALSITLMKGITYVDGNDWDNGNGLFVGRYAITGRCDNSNFDVVFRAYKEDYGDSYAMYYPNDLGATETEKAEAWKRVEDIWGVYTIRPLSVTVVIKDREGVYGSTLTDGVTELRYNAKLVNTQNIAWTYSEGSGMFTVGHEQYLDFYLRGEVAKGNIFAEVGEHQIEGFWAQSIHEGDPNYGIRLNYEVTFANERGDGVRGVFKVTPATILQNTREAQGAETFTGTLWNQTELYRGETVVYSLKVDERFFFFEGGLHFGADSLNSGSVTYDAAKVTYRDLKKDNQMVYEGIVPESELQITNYGVWTVEVTIEKANHTTAVFTLTLTVVQADLTVTLKPNARFTAVYGTYLASGQDAKSGAHTFDELKAALKTWLFSTTVIEKIDGAENISANLQTIIDALLRIGGADAIGVSIITMPSNESSGGYLNAGDYVLTFEATGNIRIKFADTYSAVTVAKRTLNMTWEPEAGDKVDMDGNNTFTYRYDGRSHNVTARPTDVLSGDQVANFGMTYYLVQDGEETVRLNLTLVGDYRVTIVVNSDTGAAGNRDIGNYEVNAVDLWVYIKAVSITVLIHDRTNEYGEQDLDPNDVNTWTIIEGADILPENEDLAITLSFEPSRGDRRPSGTYKISGRSDNSNYTVVFVGSYGETAVGKHDGSYGTYTVLKRKVIVTVHDMITTYGDYTHDVLEDLNFRTLGDTTYSTSRPEGSAGYATMAQTSSVTIFPDDMESLALSIRLDPTNAQYTGTGYLKANEAGYRLLCTYDTEFNYDLTFVLESGVPYNGSDNTSKLIVNKKELNVAIYTTSVVYGETRPTKPMNYSVSGFTPADTTWFEANRDTSASFLKFTVRNADTTDELDESRSFDPVGVYIILLESDTSVSHDIGSNYEITVTGEWTAYGSYSEDKYVGKASKYEVTPRLINIVIHSASGEYGDLDVAERFTVDVISTQFAPGDTAETIKNLINFDLTNVFDENGHTRPAGTDYDVTAVMLSPNYILDGTLTAKYQMLPREIDLRALDRTSEYGDRHQELVADGGYSQGWTAVRANGKSGSAIAYSTDEIYTLIKVATDTTSTADAGDGYRIYIDVSTIYLDKNYHVNNMTDGKLTIERRKIMIRLKPQESEYGEDHVLSDRYEQDWTAERFSAATKYSDENVVVLPNDIYDIVLRFATDVNRTSPAGAYDIAADFNNKNYVVAFVDGKYNVTPRKISVRIENASGEYGDPVSGLGWTASRAGGNAIVNGDELDITLKAVLADGRQVDTRVGIGTYPIIVTASNNPNYDITFTGDYSGKLPDTRIGEAAGIYEMTKRRIIMTFDGESEYGDPIDPFTASYRADGKEGPAIVNGDDFGYSYEWVDDPYANGVEIPEVGSYRLRVTKPTELSAAQANYEVVSDDVNYASVYNVVPRKVTISVKDGGRTYGDVFVDPNTDIMDRLDIRRTTPGKSGDAILGDDIDSFSLKVVDGDIAKLTDGIPYFAGTYNYALSYTINDPNYELTVVYGNYVVSPKRIEVQIDDKTQNYGEDLLELTHSAIEGVLDGDDLGFALSVLWGEDQEGLTWHNAGVYRIEASAANPNYTLIIDGTLDGAGKYTILKVHNSWLREYSVERLQQGSEPDPELLPEAEWGDVIIKYYLDEACTQELDRDIKDADRGTYFVKVTVLDTINWDGLGRSYTIEIFNDFLNIDGMDVTAYVCLFASQFLIGLFALLFVGRRKKQENK